MKNFELRKPSTQDFRKKVVAKVFRNLEEINKLSCECLTVLMRLNKKTWIYLNWVEFE